MKSSIKICADDWGMGPGIAEAVIALADKNRVHASSCMTNLPSWDYGIPLLARDYPQVEMGLHFCLTTGRPLSPLQSIQTLVGPHGQFYPWSIFLRRTLLGKIAREDVLTELFAQWQAFKAVLGYEPRHLDSHHHVHQLPGIRRPILAFLAGCRFGGTIRNTSFRPLQLLKQRSFVTKSLILAAGSLRFQGQIKEFGLKTNGAFCGVFPMGRSFDIGRFYRRMIHAIPSRQALLAVHPARRCDGIARWDTYTQGRLLEFEYLMSEEFLDLQDGLEIRSAEAPKSPAA